MRYEMQKGRRKPVAPALVRMTDLNRYLNRGKLIDRWVLRVEKHK